MPADNKPLISELEDILSQALRRDKKNCFYTKFIYFDVGPAKRPANTIHE